MDHSDSPLSQSHPDNLIPFEVPKRRREIEKGYEALRDLDDADFAHYHIAKWSHPSSLPDIIENIDREFAGPSHRSMTAAAESADRLIALVTSVDLTDTPQLEDSLHDIFIQAYQDVGYDLPKIKALEILHALHLISVQGETTRRGESSEVAKIIEAIVEIEEED